MKNLVDLDLIRSLKALGHPTRLQLIKLLATPELFKANLVDPRTVGVCVNDLARTAELPQSTTSHHLAVLEDAGLIVITKHGPWHYARPRRDAFKNLAAGIAVYA